MKPALLFFEAVKFFHKIEESDEKVLTIFVEMDIINTTCRCRLAVWRQLPKLFPASSTLVTCSKKKDVPCGAFFLFALDRARESNSEGEFCV